tara:strand:+ start:85106 stop:85882 length:777 start_codon:yes stop_codon:yes gene_type:complete
LISDLNIAQNAAIEAGAIILNYYKSDYQIKHKGYHNPVTTADFESNKKLKEILLGERPDYGWLSEETVDSPHRLNKEKVWIVDPIDGTKEFIEGVPNFVVSIGLVDCGKPIIGVLYNPVTNEIFTAIKGFGSFLNNKPVRCRAKENLKEMVILNSRSETDKGLWKEFKNIFGELKPIGSVAYKLGLTAAGRADVFASLRPKNEWDICAGDCIINEAGGKLIDLNGEERKYNQRNTLLTPGIIAGKDQAVDKIFKVLKI